MTSTLNFNGYLLADNCL